ncbi:S9 family peptidase [Saccharopolyspora mangrovi]|uniref:Prolyl oligopeptidase family serine peptidase n=1 Tax=Saccharopolyspora mangrovi TaxID=3082379 RepID=A0ABU6AG72_9PSEU|nr:prolyl oligopeptidase family serine peptidase [Saccharopolyspora sp. S2-29]MEB3370441.1 prolyl oligopeptidase family serine peptidase [Saccharopolyspora sp. S2-29]
MSSASFPRRSARTQGFSLGAPRNFTVVGGGARVLFLRSSSGTDSTTALWALETATGTERLLVDPATLQAGEQVSAEEQARRERARERATGITGYSTDRAGALVVFTLSDRLFAVDAGTGDARELPVQQPVADPRPSPCGNRIAYLSGGSLRVIEADGSGDRALVEPDGENVTWGAAEFIAAEEMDRHRGYWWAPDGEELLVARVDESPVRHWYLGDPAHPDRVPVATRYPAAGTANAEVSLFAIDLRGERVAIEWDRRAHPYLVTAHWSRHGSPLIAVQTRDQRTQLVLAVDTGSGTTSEIHRDTDPQWIDIKPGWPSWTPGGELVRVDAAEGAYRLVVGDRPWTSARLQVRGVLDVGAEDVLVSGTEDDPAEVHLYRVTATGHERLTSDSGVHTGTRGGDVLVVATSSLDRPRTGVVVRRGTETIAEIANHAEEHGLDLNVRLLRLGERELRSALLLPSSYTPEDGPLPVLLDPYGGPHAQRVLARQQGYLTSQWFADQGFAVLVVDGRGMAGRGPDWDRAIAGDLAGPPLQDQVDALHAAAAEHPELDLDRVAIRGWSFGGYLAGLAVLRRPDVFHAAIVGAGVVDWRLYDTHYTERYLGDPSTAPEVYEANSLLHDAPKLERPMLIVHGTVDDNVVLAHGLRLSAALTAAARPHSVLPLAGVSHMPTDETTSENLLVMQVDFLRKSLQR